jgi:hypothetical protein
MTRSTLAAGFALAALSLACASCIHVKGVVLEEHTEKPIANATFTIGQPGMIVLDTHHSDRNGRFDFYIGPTDETALYVWTGQGDPTIAPRHVDRTEISDHMIIHLFNPSDPFAP